MTSSFRMEGGTAVLPFVRMFCGSPSEYLWEDNQGNVHVVPQGEGGEQGDAMMPLLFCLGQLEAVQAVQRQLGHGERLFAFLGDMYFVTRPERLGEDNRVLEEGFSRAFASTTAKRRFGTNPRRATGWSGLHELRTPEAQCEREVGCPQIHKASTYWAPHWGTTTLWPVTSKKSRETN